MAERVERTEAERGLVDLRADTPEERGKTFPAKPTYNNVLHYSPRLRCPRGHILYHSPALDAFQRDAMNGLCPLCLREVVLAQQGGALQEIP
jgi:hypothetical protein